MISNNEKGLTKKEPMLSRVKGEGRKAAAAVFLQGFEGSKDPRNAHHFIHTRFF